MKNDPYKIDQKEEIYRQLETGLLPMGQAVRALRKIAQMTQRDFAKAVKIDIRVLADFERNQGNLRSDTICKILAPFGLVITAVRGKII